MNSIITFSALGFPILNLFSDGIISKILFANNLSDLSNKGLNVIEGEMCNIPLNSNSLDALICIAAFHHLSTVERRIKALLEMKRVVKPGGKVVISVWSIEQPAKTRRTFNKYGDTIVKWDQRRKIYDRYYYIFKLDEIKELFKKVEMELESHIWDCGNEIFVLR